MGFFLGIIPNYKPMGFYFGGLQNGESRYVFLLLPHRVLCTPDYTFVRKLRAFCNEILRKYCSKKVFC